VDSACGFTATNRNVSASVDWRSILTPVKNQGACGSCWAYSTTAAVEAVTAIMTGERLVLSEQELTDCNWQSSHCDGGNIEVRELRALTRVCKGLRQILPAHLCIRATPPGGKITQRGLSMLPRRKGTSGWWRTGWGPSRTTRTTTQTTPT
jgi:hypothetical protein